MDKTDPKYVKGMDQLYECARVRSDKERKKDKGLFASMIQDVNISTNLSKEDTFELGKRKPYYRYANFPVASGV